MKDHFTLPRFGFLEGASLAENICRMTGIWQPLMLKLPRYRFLKTANKKRAPLNKIRKKVVSLLEY